ncbi:hypothetical protein GCM10010515_45350 [Streptomyces fructofermentans]|uniref:Uncharacterized protein n=2 Tax=Streptomyces fructofermentans TaxID=152141 RepID=A0A918NJQ8_9ACTN|nr:hypothetical protein GCM10010515_45350 [Streptomyces fructofermentans]
MANPTTRAEATVSEPARRPYRQGPKPQMKTTMMFRNIANPRRTTLAHLEDAEELRTQELLEHSVELPAQTANPRRTILMDVPVAAGVAE